MQHDRRTLAQIIAEPWMRPAKAVDVNDSADDAEEARKPEPRLNSRRRRELRRAEEKPWLQWRIMSGTPAGGGRSKVLGTLPRERPRSFAHTAALQCWAK
jgi:hypothetical protein